MLDVKSQDISIPEAVVVLCTAPDEATAQDLAAKVLAEKTGRLRHPPPRRDIAVLLGRQTGAGV
ncbi:Divalent cation tolerance protein [Salmonella enterica subsp. enterica]|uniref:Divalent cation tolerance protein n=1 Tax=Salmonella enterica I TaxID=59201 RepID=A0A3S4LRE0_SALET|nr:Divalent cation tolerance protein [Salmonella enterica subsp. enterica]